ncbi:hypothetical protein APED_07135 [Acanthopleuribacter pedis]
MTQINPKFLESLERSTDEVAKWPEWKRNIMFYRGRVVRDTSPQQTLGKKSETPTSRDPH